MAPKSAARSHPQEIIIPQSDRLALNPIGHSSEDSKWKTAAQRAHDAPRLLVFSKGQGRITISGKVRGFGPNNVIFLPAKTLYGIEMGPTAFGQSLTIPRAMEGDWPEDIVHMRLRDVAAIKEMQTYLDQLERELNSDAQGAQRAALYRAGLLSVFLMRQMGDQEPETQQENAADRVVAAYTDLIAHDMQPHRSVTDYAAMLGVTPTHLTRCCKKSCGQSALALLNERVMFEARLALGNSRRPIQDIASDLGFGSAAYFTRAFQAETGMTPSAFRKRGPVHTA